MGLLKNAQQAVSSLMEPRPKVVKAKSKEPKEPKEPKAAVVKTPKTEEGGVRKKTRKARVQKFDVYIHRVLKEVTPGISISGAGDSLLNYLISAMLERIHREAAFVTKYNKKTTLTARECAAALKMVLPPKMAERVEQAGKDAVEKSIAG